MRWRNTNALDFLLCICKMIFFVCRFVIIYSVEPWQAASAPLASPPSLFRAWVEMCVLWTLSPCTASSLHALPLHTKRPGYTPCHSFHFGLLPSVTPLLIILRNATLRCLFSFCVIYVYKIAHCNVSKTITFKVLLALQILKEESGTLLNKSLWPEEHFRSTACLCGGCACERDSCCSSRWVVAVKLVVVVLFNHQRGPAGILDCSVWHLNIIGRWGLLVSFE